MQEFQVVFGRGPRDYVVLFRGTLEECIKARQSSGDLILTPGVSPNRVLKGKHWLWEWERNDPTCYAQRMQKFWTH